MSSSNAPEARGTLDCDGRLRPVDPRVRDFLRKVAVRQARHGVRVFLFGSVARTWPRASIGADLDLGFEIDSSRTDRDTLRRDLEQEVASLPSIRPVDLVDFSQVDGVFRAEVEKHIVELAHEPAETATD